MGKNTSEKVITESSVWRLFPTDFALKPRVLTHHW